MPREAPVTRAMREARRRGIESNSLRHVRHEARLRARRPGHPRLWGRVLQTWMAGTSPAMTKYEESPHYVIPGWSEGPDLRCAIAHRGISRFRVWCSRNIAELEPVAWHGLQRTVQF